jgi:hypothetical protein
MVSPFALRARALRCLLIALVASATGCRDASSRAPAPAPPADFVIAAGDSVFWVTSVGGTVSFRGAPLELARVNGRFYEVYVADDDRSFEDAVLIGQRIYRRDLLSGDSLLVYEDTIIPRLAIQYARLHPDDRPLRPDEETSDDPLWNATSTVEVADLHGRFLSYSIHADIERGDAPLWHTSRRGVLDLVLAAPASLAEVAGSAAPDVVRRRAVVAAMTMDSVQADGGDEDRARVATVLPSYRLDPQSFSLTTTDGSPAVAYALSGEGTGEAGHLLALPPIPIGEPAWWKEVAITLPISSADGTRDSWRGPAYDVVVRYDSVGSGADLSLRDRSSREWPVGRLPVPASRVFWLDHPAIDTVARKALLRAFDESTLYDENVRSASNHGAHSMRHSPVRLAGHRSSRRARSVSLRHRL